MKEYGYVRVSTLDQNEERQMVEIRNESGGTAACVRMAEQLGRAIIKI